MKTRLLTSALQGAAPAGFPDADEIAVLRAWYTGMSTRGAVERYLPGRLGQSRSARGVLGQIRRALVSVARRAKRDDFVELLEHPVTERMRRAKAVSHAIEILRYGKPPEPEISDPVERWFSERAARALRAQGIATLADLTVRIPRRRMWWKTIPGLGATSAKRIEAVFAAHPALTARARVLIETTRTGIVAPWESLRLPHEVDGSNGSFRAPRATCVLSADNDYAAVQAWLSLHESVATQRTYRKEAERLILWAIVERGKALSSLTTEDAVAYRAFLRRPTPATRWVGPQRPRSSSEWRPFVGGLSGRSVAHALSIIGALFRWLVEQRYVLANPFAGVKVREGARTGDLDDSRAFTDGEWALLRVIADGLEWSYGWSESAAQRLRFVLDVGFATGLRAGELVGARLRDIELTPQGERWLHVRGKGSKLGKVALPPLAWNALSHYLLARGLPVSPARWRPDTPLIGNLDEEAAGAISSARLWAVLHRFFLQASGLVAVDHLPLANKLRRASTHWMRHTHATFALSHGAELTAVRDNLRHASISTTSTYLHSDEVRRARQMASAFGITK
ncbi:Integrase family protein [Paraburkholderia piptadeniae]|uniref:Tyrosine-type recombinase/integrase n=2 Tax=Paraburkholderia TaxID=1822464 RepID=A0A7X1TL97_9BURK|nr:MULTISPECIES: site-specific integrase [Paraburkholderia]MPW23263.1 tyrosine-type recombinase/integrase [Paraburkholderia franconis]SIT51613.1 Integrase family protein [Paraburkholderia piptadeniae]